MRDYITRRDLDTMEVLTPIRLRVERTYNHEDASVIVESLADALLDGVDLLMAVEEWDDEGESTYGAVECWLSQLKIYGLENDEILVDLVDDAFLSLSIEAGVRDLQSIDPSQYL